MNPYIYPGIGSLKVRRQIENKERLRKVGYTMDNIFLSSLSIVNLHNRTSYTATEVKGRSRKREIVEIRQAAMYLMSLYTKSSLKYIGNYFGGRDHSTTIHAKRTWSALMDTDRRYKELTEEILADIRIRGLAAKIAD